MKRIAAVALAFGCGPQVPVDDADSQTAGDTTGRESDTNPGTTIATTVSTSTSAGTTASTSAGSTAATSVSSTSDVETTAVDTGVECTADPDGSGVDCDLWAEDCPCGEKCMPWANDGGSSWNALRCSPIADRPKQVGEPCTVEGSGVSGIDDCELHSMCWDVDPETNQGTCAAFCIGSLLEPGCADACSTCLIANETVLTLCLPTCNPLLSDCDVGEECVYNEGAFLCAPDVGGELGAFGDPCEFINVCDPGLTCAPAQQVPGCEGPVGCCTPFCPVDEPLSCSGLGPGFECTPLAVDVPGCQDSSIGSCVAPEGG